MNDYTRNALVAANEFRDLGEADVLMSGSSEWVDGTAGNQPRFNTVAGNYIHNVGLYVLQAPGERPLTPTPIPIPTPLSGSQTKWRTFILTCSPEKLWPSHGG